MSFYCDSFIGHCERRDTKSIVDICNNPESSFEMIQQGVDIAIRDNNLIMLLLVLFKSVKLTTRLIKYMIDKGHIETIKTIISIDIPPYQYIPHIMYTAAMERHEQLLDTMSKYLNDPEYIPIRLCAYKISAAGHKDVEFKKLLYLSKGIDVSIIWNVKNTDYILKNRPLNDIIRLLNICDYVYNLPETRPIKDNIKLELSKTLNKHMIKDISAIVANYIYG
jgi:hypothetical protein